MLKLRGFNPRSVFCEAEGCYNEQIAKQFASLELETERLILRNMTQEDYLAAFRWCGDPEVNKYMIYPLYQCAEDVKTWLKTREEELDNPDDYDVGFVLKESGELIGSGGLSYNQKLGGWIIGYNIVKEQWGRGADDHV